MKILNIGSLNIDHVYRVDHVVAPGETLSSTELNLFCGGKGLNQSIAAARAGTQVWHAGKIGNDGAMLVSSLRECGVHTDLIQVSDGIPTGHAIIQVDRHGQNCIIVHGGANTSITPEDIDGFLSHFSAGDIFLTQNEISSLPYALEQAKKKGMLVALNPSPIGDLASSPALDWVDIFILNEVEGLQITGESDPQEICTALLRRYPRCKVMLTLGKSGCLYAEEGRRTSHGIYDTAAVDTTAAGDTFVGYFLSGLCLGNSIEDILTTASKASAIAVSRAGASVSIPDRQEAASADIHLISRG